MSVLLKLLNDPTDMFLDKYLDQFPDGTPEKQLLTIFCYGQYEDYVKLEESLPNELKLAPDSMAIKKLRELTILSQVKNVQQISYEILYKATGLNDLASLESIIIELMANDLIIGKIDEEKNSFLIERVESRCIRNSPEDLEVIIQQISGFRNRINAAIQEAK